MTLEAARQLVTAYTVDFTPDEREQIAAAMVANDSCLWHATTAYVNQRDGTAKPCNCGGCRKGVAPQFTYAGVAGGASDGAPG